MRKLPSLLMLLLAAGVLGCGDSPQAMLRDLITFRNELADEALRVTDDASAKATREGRLKKMKDRQEWIKDRIEQMVKDSKKKVQQFADAAKENAAELLASAAYVARAQTWLESVGGEAAAMSNEIKTLSEFTLPQPPTQTTAPTGG